MRVRKLLHWRMLLLYSHRWLGIVVGLMFLAWCVSGVVLMYYGVPNLSAGERLMRMSALDLSDVRVTPAEAAVHAPGAPFRLRISMLGERPVYRINSGPVFGTWTVVYADTGEPLEPMDAAAALAWVRDFVPEHAATLRYDALLTGPDNFTRLPALQNRMPMHRIALGDAASTRYYVSAESGEAVVKTDRWSRFLGIAGYMTHRLFFFRQQSWWNPLLDWLTWLVFVMAVTGAVFGVLRFSPAARFKRLRARSPSPYAGVMKWHHYTGLIFGLFALTWMFSGLAARGFVPGMDWPPYTPQQIQAGARSVQGRGQDVDLDALSVEGIQGALQAFQTTFVPTEMELLQFDGEPFFIAYRPPTRNEALRWVSRTGVDILSFALDWEHALVSGLRPHEGVFSRFDDDTMMRAARRAMPGVPVLEAEWLHEFDDYYYYAVSSFNQGLPKTVRTLPVLRVKFDDPARTWLYLTPSHGQIIKREGVERARRWGMFGLHALDFSFLYDRRPLWDIVSIVLLIGTAALACTTLLPAWRRLARHARRLRRAFAGGAARPRTPGVVAARDDDMQRR